MRVFKMTFSHVTDDVAAATCEQFLANPTPIPD